MVEIVALEGADEPTLTVVGAACRSLEALLSTLSLGLLCAISRCVRMRASIETYAEQ